MLTEAAACKLLNKKHCVQQLNKKAKTRQQNIHVDSDAEDLIARTSDTADHVE